jgi:hypothetical protein
MNEFTETGFFGPIILTTGSGNSINITEMVYELNVYESIFSNTLMADITIQDTPTMRLIQKGLIAAKDKVEFEFSGKKIDGSPEKTIKLSLFVVKMKNGSPIGQTSQTLKLYLTSEQHFINKTKEISTYIEGKISDSISKIVKNNLNVNKLSIEDCNEEFKATLKYASPFEHINMLLSRTGSTKNPNDYNYVFYQTVDDLYKLITIGSMMKEQPKIGSDSTTGFIITMPHISLTKEQLKRTCLSQESYNFSMMENASNGMWSSQHMTFDTSKKTYRERTYCYNNEFKKQSHLSKSKVVSDSDQKQIENIVKNSFITRYTNRCSFLFDCEEEKDNKSRTSGSDDWLLKRMSCIEQMNQIKLIFSAPGNSTLRAGDVIYFGRPIQQYLSKDNPKKDIMYNGKFLITDIKHVLKHNINDAGFNYTITVKVMKDSTGDE